ncbi:unnamed protein product [Durusdinium trenchii]|uniref:Cation efflux protein transmembrane domain-containing protein n=1 Tax=Durusdinium trenchii TaxID=1381693 RepID=A0ABP0HQC3_9DINO
MLAGRCRCSLWGQRLARNRLQESRSISRKKLTSLKTPDFFSRRSFCSNEPTRRFKEFQEMLKEPDDIWIRGSEARRMFNLTRDDLQELGENYMVKANPFDAEQAPFKQYSLKEVVALALRKHSEQSLLDHFQSKLLRWQAQSDASRKLYGQHDEWTHDGHATPAALPRGPSISQKRYWYNAPSTTTTQGWQSVMQGLKTNSCICFVKGGVWMSTGSHAMFADWMHSIADVANYAYRLMELSRSGRKRDVAHPYGYAPLRYITADRSFVFLFFVGGVLPLGLGVQELLEAATRGVTPGDLLVLPAAVFLVSAMLEGSAVRAAYREILSQAEREKIGAPSTSLLGDLRQVAQYLGQGRDAELLRRAFVHAHKVMSTATFTEASSGVLSSLVGLVGLGFSYQLQTGVPDVAASIVMASIVSCVSAFLLGKSGNALLGQTLPHWRVKSLIETLESHAAVALKL